MAQVIDIRENPYQQMQISREMGESIGKMAREGQKLATERKLVSIMADKSLTEQDRFNKVREAGGLWYTSGQDVKKFMQQPEVKQRFMQQQLGQDIYQQDYQKQQQIAMQQQQQNLGMVNELYKMRSNIAQDPTMMTPDGKPTAKGQEYLNYVDQQLQQYQPSIPGAGQQPTLAQEQLVTESKKSGLDVEQSSLSNTRLKQQIEQQEYQVKQREIAEEKASLENQELEAKVEGIKNKATPSGGLSGKDKMDAETTLRKEYNANTTVKAYNTVRTYKNVIEAAASRIKKGERLATDETIIVGLKKMIEPDSVVRESEYARTPESVGYLDGLRGRLVKLTDGGSGIPADKLQEITALVEQIENIHREAYDVAISPYEQHAEEYGLNKDLIFSDFPTQKSEPPLSSPILSTDGGLIEIDLDDVEGVDSLPEGYYIDKNTGKTIYVK